MSTPVSTEPPRDGVIVHTVTLVAGLVTIAGLVLAGVVLSLKGKSTPDILGLLTGLATVAGLMLAALNKVVGLERSTDQQTATLRVLDERTNGTMAATIRAAVDEALAARFGPLPGEGGPGGAAVPGSQ